MKDEALRLAVVEKSAEWTPHLSTEEFRKRRLTTRESSRGAERGQQGRNRDRETARQKPDTRTRAAKRPAHSPRIGKRAPGGRRSSHARQKPKKNMLARNCPRIARA